MFSSFYSLIELQNVGNMFLFFLFVLLTLFRPAYLYMSSKPSPFYAVTAEDLLIFIDDVTDYFDVVVKYLF